MWIRKLPDDYYNHKSFCYESVFVWKNGNAYVMDNHLSAAWCWMQSCEVTAKYNFMHIDKHYDMLECFKDADIASMKLTPHISYDSYKNLKRSSDDYLVFRWDNYIMAAYCLFPEWFQSNIFMTQKDGDIGTTWGHTAFKFREEDPLFMDSVIDQFIGNPSQYLDGLTEVSYNLPWIVNIDLDVFYSHSSPYLQLFSDDYIQRVARTLNKYRDNIQVLTIALSPDCIGGENLKSKWNNAFHILKVLSEELDNIKDFPFPHTI